MKSEPFILVYLDMRDDVGEERKGEKIHIESSEADSQSKQVKPSWGWKEEASVSPSPDSELKLILRIMQAWLLRAKCNPHSTFTFRLLWEVVVRGDEGGATKTDLKEQERFDQRVTAQNGGTLLL